MQVLKFYFNLELTGYFYALTTKILANLFICIVTAGMTFVLSEWQHLQYIENQIKEMRKRKY